MNRKETSITQLSNPVPELQAIQLLVILLQQVQQDLCIAREWIYKRKQQKCKQFSVNYPISVTIANNTFVFNIFNSMTVMQQAKRRKNYTIEDCIQAHLCIYSIEDLWKENIKDIHVGNSIKM